MSSSNKSPLVKKREQFHKQIRKKQIQEKVKKMRYQLLQNQKNQSLDNLINMTQTQISEEQLKILVEQGANLFDYPNAIIHIGNLLIDKALDPQFLMSKFQLKPKSSDYWPWVIRILVSFNCINDHLVIYILQKVPDLLSNFSLLQCLQTIKKILNSHSMKMTQLLLKKHSNTIVKIKESCLNADKKISNVSFEIVDKIIQQGDQQTHQFVKICTFQQIQHLIITGFSKLDPSFNKFPFLLCRIVNNILSSKIVLSQKVIKQAISVSLKDNLTEKTIVQFSYLWLSFVQCSSSLKQKQILTYAYEHKFLTILENFLDRQIKKQAYQKQLIQNIKIALKIFAQTIKKLYNQEEYALMNMSCISLFNHEKLKQKQSKFQKISVPPSYESKFIVEQKEEQIILQGQTKRKKKQIIIDLESGLVISSSDDQDAIIDESEENL